MEQTEITDYPLVTIIAICHNHKPYVAETLDSIRNQSYPNIQCIIVNNLADDGCKEVIENWLEKHQYDALFIQNETPLSLPKNLNMALKHTKGKYFQAISCDDVLYNNKIESQINLFENSNENVSCVYSDMKLINSQGGTLNTTIFQRYGQDDFDIIQTEEGLKKMLGYRCIIPAPSILLKTAVIKNLGGYDVQYDAEDWPLYFKLLRYGYGFKGFKSPLVKYRILETSLAKTKNLTRLKTLADTFHNNKDLIANISPSRRKWLGVAIRIGGFSVIESIYLFSKIIFWSKGKAIIDIPYVIYGNFFNRISN